MAVYLIQCEICGEQYTGSTKTKFRSRANNYKCTQRTFVNKEAVPKQAQKRKRFHEHYCSDRHNDIQDRVITLIDNADTLKELRRKELYTYVPYGRNEKDIYKIDRMFSIYNSDNGVFNHECFFFLLLFIFLSFI